MPAEENIAVVRRYFDDCVSRASGPRQDAALALVDELLTSDFVMFYNNDTDVEGTRGRERHREFLVDHARVFPNDRWTVEQIVADGEMVACTWHFHATHAETGNLIDARAADFFRVRDGRLAELRRFLDFKSLGRQMRPATRPPGQR